MREEAILDALGQIDADLIEETDALRMKKRSDKKIPFGWIAAAACFVLAAGFTLARLGVFSAVPFGANETGSAFLSDAGPVYLLECEAGKESLAAERHVEFDFSPYEGQMESYTDANGKEVQYRHIRQAAAVTDSYTLTNTSEQPQGYYFEYPFAASLSDEADLFPTVSMNGLGSDVLDWVIEETETAEDLREMYSQKATVYELYDLYGEGEEGQSPRVEIAFTTDPDQTKILSYGFNGVSWYEDSRYEFSVSIPQAGWPDREVRAFVIAVGEDIGEYSICGYTSGAKEEVLEDAGCAVRRTETTLGEILVTILRDEYFPMLLEGREGDELVFALGPENFAELAASFLYTRGILSDAQEDRFDAFLLDDVFSYLYGMRRVMKVCFSVSIPAGETVTLSLRMMKNASFDYGGTGNDTSRNGYALLVSSENSLHCREQTFSVRNLDFVEILEQDFGFDPDNGAEKVTLDPEKGQYSMVLRAKTDK